MPPPPPPWSGGAGPAVQPPRTSPPSPGCSPRGRPQLIRVGLQPTAPPPCNSRGREPGANVGLRPRPAPACPFRFPDRGERAGSPTRIGVPRTGIGVPAPGRRGTRGPLAAALPRCPADPERPPLPRPRGPGWAAPAEDLTCPGSWPPPRCLLHQPDAERRALRWDASVCRPRRRWC